MALPFWMSLGGRGVGSNPATSFLSKTLSIGFYHSSPFLDDRKNIVLSVFLYFTNKELQKILEMCVCVCGSGTPETK
jgi:hypothetical protein